MLFYKLKRQHPLTIYSTLVLWPVIVLTPDLQPAALLSRVRQTAVAVTTFSCSKYDEKAHSSLLTQWATEGGQQLPEGVSWHLTCPSKVRPLNFLLLTLRIWILQTPGQIQVLWVETYTTGEK